MDYKDLTDQQLEEFSLAILSEIERRSNLARIPATIADLSKMYADGGGDREELIKAVDGHE